MAQPQNGRVSGVGLLVALATVAMLLAANPGCSDGTNGGTDTRPTDALGDSDQVSDAPTHPTNGWVVWNSNREGNNQIYRMRADGSDKTALTTTGGEAPKWAPDGRFISYTDPSDNPRASCIGLAATTGA